MLNPYRVTTFHKDGHEVQRTVHAHSANDAVVQVEAEIKPAKEEKFMRVEPLGVTPKQVEFMREMTTRPAP